MEESTRRYRAPVLTVLASHVETRMVCFMKRYLSFFLLMFCFASVSVLGQETQQRRVVPDRLRNAEMQLLGVRTIKLSDFSGKVIVLNLFGTWCGPCRFESPALAELYRQFDAQKVEIIELSTEDMKKSKSAVQKWVDKYRLPYKVGWIPTQFAEELMAERPLIPQTFIILPNGAIFKRFIGYGPQTTISLKQAVEEALVQGHNL